MGVTMVVRMTCYWAVTVGAGVSLAVAVAVAVTVAVTVTVVAMDKAIMVDLGFATINYMGMAHVW